MTTRTLKKVFRGEHGQTAVEMSVILGMITVGIVAAFGAFTGAVGTALQAAAGLF